MLRVLVVIIASAFSAAIWAGDLPDTKLTPGAINPDVNQSNIEATICKRGWTSTIRPPVSYADQLKVGQIGQYRYADTDPAHYEEDHLISLGLGGDPLSPKNLWPQPNSGKWNFDMKNKLENVLNKLVCARRMTLAEAQREIRTDWTAAFKRHVVDPAATEGLENAGARRSPEGIIKTKGPCCRVP